MEEKRYEPIALISDEDKEALKRMTAYYMPDAPSASGMKPNDIRGLFWKAFLHGDKSMVGFFNRAIADFNAALAALYEIYGDTLSAESFAKNAEDAAKVASDAAQAAKDAKGYAERAAEEAESAEENARSYKNEAERLLREELNKQAIVNAVLAALPAAEGRSF